MGLRIAFDLDGTLIDSLPHIHQALSNGLRDRDLPPVSIDVMRGFVGNGLSKLIARTLKHLDQDAREHKSLSERVLFHYVSLPSDPQSVYPGVSDCLDRLRADGHHLAICTNKPFQAAIVALHQTQLLPFFDLVIGGDSLPTNKPDAQMLTACAPDLFVGDSEVDAETAKAARTPFALFTEGYRKGPVASLPHSFAFEDYAALPSFASKYLGEREG